jgi:hypothetical protein
MHKITMYDFKQILTTNYLFHVHTDLTDGKWSIEDVCKFASEQGFESVIFTEHIRTNPTYDYIKYAQEVLDMGSKYGLKRVLPGVEAKILPSGELDFPISLRDSVPVLCFADHGLGSAGVEAYYDCLIKNFTHGHWRTHIKVWVHPFRSIGDKMDIALMRSMAIVASKFGVLVEKPPIGNDKYAHIFDGCERIAGWDLHNKLANMKPLKEVLS